MVPGDSLEYMATMKPGSVDLVVTSPPFGLVRKKDYGNVQSGEYLAWFKPFGEQIKRILKRIERPLNFGAAPIERPRSV
jgi:DNA modification methylase